MFWRLFRLFLFVLPNFWLLLRFTACFQEGDQLPSVDLFEDLPTNKVNTGELAANKKIILFAVPGAFTPGCSKVSIFMAKTALMYFNCNDYS